MVSGTGRSPASLAAIRAAGMAPLPFDEGGAIADIARALRRTTHLVTSIPPGPAGDPVLRCFREAILHDMPALEWIGYLSTTGVYGDHGGAWVDEQTVCRPATERARRRLAVEQEWQELAASRRTPVAVLRLSGIYGPGRNALVSVARGEARRIVAPGQWFSRIHVADIAAATALLARGAAGGVYNISDDEPAAPQDVILYAAALLGVEPPSEIPLDSPLVSPGLRAFYAANRRVSNRLIRAHGYQFRYPDYRAGLTALLEAGDGR
jgi:nucleoside-diphosphate-sugar epimerase